MVVFCSDLGLKVDRDNLSFVISSKDCSFIHQLASSENLASRFLGPSVSLKHRAAKLIPNFSTTFVASTNVDYTSSILKVLNAWNMKCTLRTPSCLRNLPKELQKTKCTTCLHTSAIKKWPDIYVIIFFL